MREHRFSFYHSNLPLRFFRQLQAAVNSARKKPVWDFFISIAVAFMLIFSVNCTGGNLRDKRMQAYVVLSHVEKGLKEYRVKTGGYPKTDSWEAMVGPNSPLVTRRIIESGIPINDPWGNPYEGKSTKNSFEIKCVGRTEKGKQLGSITITHEKIIGNPIEDVTEDVITSIIVSVVILLILATLVIFFIFIVAIKSKKPKFTQVSVDSAQGMESAITSYIAEGFSLVNKTDKSATMQKKKQFNPLWAVVGFVLCIIPLIIYLFIYAAQTDVQVVEIVVSS
jgi:hypothetical protein